MALREACRSRVGILAYDAVEVLQRAQRFVQLRVDDAEFVQGIRDLVVFWIEIDHQHEGLAGRLGVPVLAVQFAQPVEGIRRVLTVRVLVYQLLKYLCRRSVLMSLHQFVRGLVRTPLRRRPTGLL